MKRIPTPRQLAFLDWEMGFFFHFGIRSFYHGHNDWDGKPMPAEGFLPNELDCGQWVRVAKETGAKYAILVCKHHDGFANWPSAYSDYSVAQSPWKDGKGDVVREFTDACRAEGLKVGLYYSPAQWQGSISFTEDKAYDDYFIHQITELLTNYGKIDYLWFDGCGSANHQYDKERIIATIRSLQPEILLFGMWDPDTRWIGNEDGYAPMPNPLTVEKDDPDQLVAAQNADRWGFIPAECDCMLRDTWFYDLNEDSIKSVNALVGMYEYSVGRGSNLLLNVGPDDRGLLPEADIARLKSFRAELVRRYGTPLPFGKLLPAGQADSYAIALNGWQPEFNSHPNTAEVDTVLLSEDVSNGDAIRAFRVFATLPVYGNREICVFNGETVGHKTLCRFPAIRTARLRVEVTAHEGDYRLTDMQAFCVNKTV